MPIGLLDRLAWLNGVTTDPKSLYDQTSRTPVDTSDVIFTRLNQVVSDKLTILEKSFLETNLYSKEEVEKADDPFALMYYVTRLRLKATETLAQEGIGLLRQKLDVQALTCCLINALGKADAYETLNHNYRENVQSVRRLLTVMLVMLKLIRSSLQQETKPFLVDISLNFVKQIMDSLFSMTGAMYYQLVSILRANIVQRLSDWMRRNKLAWINCVGFINLFSLFLHHLFGQGGMLAKMRSLLYQELLRQRARYQKSLKIVQNQAWLSWVESVIWIITNLIAAIDAEDLCFFNASPVPVNKPNKPVSSTPPIDIPNPEDGQPAVPGSDDGNPTRFDPSDPFRTPGGYPATTDSASLPPTGNAAMSPSVSMQRILRDSDPAEIAKFLTVYLKQPSSSVRQYATKGATGDCADRLNPEDRQRLNDILNSIGL
jgi:hypothetical protein